MLMIFLKLIFAGALALVVSSCSIAPSSDTESSILAEEKMYGNVPYESAAVIKFYPKGHGRNEIRLLCFIANTPESFFDLPCKDILFKIQTLDGETVESKSTDSEGRLRFSVKNKQRYKVEVVSAKYRTLSEEIILSSGADTLIRLVSR